jgi:hypothetical protein
MCETTHYLLWNDGACRQWLEALALPIQPWSYSFLQAMGFSTEAISNIEIWNQCYIAMMDSVEEPLSNLPGISGSSQIIRPAVIKFFQQISAATSREMAIEIDYWVRMHFYDPSLIESLACWDRLLSAAYSFKQPNQYRVTPPPFLVNALQEISHLVDGEISLSYLRDILQVSEKWLEDNPQIGIDREVQMFSVATVDRVISHSSTVQAMNILADRLNMTEVQELVAWAYMQACIFKTRLNTNRLRGDRLIRVTHPCCNTPPIMDSLT